MTEAPGTVPGRETVSLLVFVNAVLRRRRLLVIFPTVFVALLVVMVLLAGRTYTAEATFIPSTPDNPLSKFSGLAAEFGVVLGGGKGGQSPDFYIELLNSREVLGPIVADSYTVKTADGPLHGTLIDLLKIPPGDSAIRRERALRAMDPMIRATVGFKSGIVTLDVTAAYPELAADIATKLVARVDKFNVESRQSEASKERAFAEQRASEAEQELRASEQKVEQFLERNRSYQNSPQLLFIYDGLNRDLQTRQAVYTSLDQAYEQSRIDEVRETPVITIIQRPEIPVYPDRRHLISKGILAVIAGLGLAVILALILEAVNRTSRDLSDEQQEFESLVAATLADLRRLPGPWRRRPAN
ncbi:MAG: Wzz/FepE/Etk N-terminal domain-containing protein [Gemmatimonadota bacterium]